MDIRVEFTHRPFSEALLWGKKLYSRNLTTKKRREALPSRQFTSASRLRSPEALPSRLFIWSIAKWKGTDFWYRYAKVRILLLQLLKKSQLMAKRYRFATFIALLAFKAFCEGREGAKRW